MCIASPTPIANISHLIINHRNILHTPKLLDFPNKKNVLEIMLIKITVSF
jgi:hypothetical protein